MWLLLTLNNIYLSARHTSGTANVLADALSRFHLGDAHVAYVNHVVAALDLNQVFPNDLLFFFYCILAYIYLYLNHGFIFLFIGEFLLIDFLSHYSFLSQIPTTLYSLFNSIWCWRNNNHVM